MREFAYNEILIKSDLAEKILADLYQIHGKATPLPGEVDFNFKINVKGIDSYILKTSTR